MQDTKSLVREFLFDNFVMDGKAVIEDDTSFMDSHLLDSTGFIELVSFVEERFGVEVPDADLRPENFDSLRNIESYLSRKQKLDPT